MEFRDAAVPVASLRLRSNLHFIVVGAAVLALVPALAYLRLPIAWPWRFVLGFSRGVAIQSVCAATALYLIQHPAELRFLWRRYRDPRRLLLLAAVCGAVVWRSGLHQSTYVKLIDAIAVLELVQRWREGRLDLKRAGWAVLPAGFYFIAGFVLVFTYNEVVVSRRFYGAEDDALNRLDLRLFGTTVSAVAHRAAAVLGARGFDVIEALYYGMFAQLGATILICGLGQGPRQAVRFVGALMLAQALALTIFYLWPSQGPLLHLRRPLRALAVPLGHPRLAEGSAGGRPASLGAPTAPRDRVAVLRFLPVHAHCPAAHLALVPAPLPAHGRRARGL